MKKCAFPRVFTILLLPILPLRPLPIPLLPQTPSIFTSTHSLVVQYRDTAHHKRLYSSNVENSHKSPWKAICFCSIFLSTKEIDESKGEIAASLHEFGGQRSHGLVLLSVHVSPAQVRRTMRRADSAVHVDCHETHFIVNPCDALANKCYRLFNRFLRRTPVFHAIANPLRRTNLIAISPTPVAEHAPDWLSA